MPGSTSIAVRPELPGPARSLSMGNREMADYPDIYADGFSLTAGPFGITLTLTRTEPTLAPGPHQDPGQIVGRVRMSQPLARAIMDAFAQVSAAAANAQVQTVSDKTN